MKVGNGNMNFYDKECCADCSSYFVGVYGGAAVAMEERRAIVTLDCQGRSAELGRHKVNFPSGMNADVADVGW